MCDHELQSHWWLHNVPRGKGETAENLNNDTTSQLKTLLHSSHIHNGPLLRSATRGFNAGSVDNWTPTQFTQVRPSVISGMHNITFCLSRTQSESNHNKCWYYVVLGAAVSLSVSFSVRCKQSLSSGHVSTRTPTSIAIVKACTIHIWVNNSHISCSICVTNT